MPHASIKAGGLRKRAFKVRSTKPFHSLPLCLYVTWSWSTDGLTSDPPSKTKPGACGAVRGAGGLVCVHGGPPAPCWVTGLNFSWYRWASAEGEGRSFPLGLSAGPHGSPMCLSYKASLKTEETIRAYRKLQYTHTHTHNSDWLIERKRDNIQWVQHIIWSKDSTLRPRCPVCAAGWWGEQLQWPSIIYIGP